MLVSLTNQEMELTGGVNGGEIAGGVAIVGGVLLAAATAPVSVPILLVGALISSIAAGYMITDGATH